jgi:nondiscriminating aspartyl-tRNA synthetase
MALLRDVIAHILETLSAQYANELKLLHLQSPVVPAIIPHIHFSEAQELIFNRYGTDVRGEPDLSPQDERWL